jgi:hypothetical protein
MGFDLATMRVSATVHARLTTLKAAYENDEKRRTVTFSEFLEVLAECWESRVPVDAPVDGPA